MSNPRTLKPFQPGFDPRRNLKGRPPGKSVKSQIEEVLNRKIEGTVDRTIAHALVEKVIKMALNGDQQMIKLIWEYSDGKPPQAKREPEVVRPAKRKLSQEEIDRIDEIFAPKDWPDEDVELGIAYGPIKHKRGHE